MMASTSEPNVLQSGQKPEAILQEAVTNEVAKILERSKASQSLVEYFILPGFGLDLAVFIQRNDHFTVRFFEFKAFVGARPGGIGFGNGYGQGFQVDLLLLEKAQLDLADRFIRWILVDGTKSLGTRRFVIVNNSQAKKHAMGGVSRGKQNNLRVNSLMAAAITWDDLSRELESFLLQV
ncbi:hypothetical protein ES703_88815 [subsurface metagenome]